MQRFIFCFTFAFLFQGKHVFAQQSFFGFSKNYPLVLAIKQPNFLLAKPSININPFYKIKPDTAQHFFAPNLLLANYYSQNLGFMCQQEIKLEKAIKLPLKIRLGSKDEVDFLEGKFLRH